MLKWILAPVFWQTCNMHSHYFDALPSLKNYFWISRKLLFGALSIGPMPLELRNWSSCMGGVLVMVPEDSYLMQFLVGIVRR